jgi:hypothetical protein
LLQTKFIDKVILLAYHHRQTIQTDRENNGRATNQLTALPFALFDRATGVDNSLVAVYTEALKASACTNRINFNFSGKPLLLKKFSYLLSDGIDCGTAGNRN